MQTTGQALNDPTTILGRAALAQTKRNEQMKNWTPEQIEEWARKAAASTR